MIKIILQKINRKLHGKYQKLRKIIFGV